jgi:hypothetical protein
MLLPLRALALLAAGSSALAAAQAPPSLPPPLQPPVPKAERAAPSDKTPAAPAKPLPPEAVLVELSGVLHDVDRHHNRMTVDTSGGPVTLGFDRNTMVYTASGLGTVRDLVPGTQLRAGRNVAMRAYWVQLRPPSGEPASTPGQGTGPAGGAAAPPGERGGQVGTPPNPGTPGPGSEAPGTTPPTGGMP